jgi:hypothetical protein
VNALKHSTFAAKSAGCGGGCRSAYAMADVEGPCCTVWGGLLHLLARGEGQITFGVPSVEEE